MPVAALRAEVETFLSHCQEPVLIEPGEAAFALGAEQYALTEKGEWLLLEAWDEARTLVRRVVGVGERRAARMVLEVAKFGGKAGHVTLADRGRAQAAPALVRGSREVLRELLKRWLARQYARWTAVEVTCGADLEHTLSPAFARGLVRLGEKRRVALAAPRGSGDLALAFGLIWLDYVGRRERAAVEGLTLFLPEGEETNTLARLPHLRVDVEVFRYDTGGVEEAVDRADRGNLATRVEPWWEPPPEPQCEAEEWLRQLSLRPGVERVMAQPGEVSLRVHGLEFARYAGGALRYGVDRKQEAKSLEAVERLAAELARVRDADGPERGHAWFGRNPEAWLESRLRAAPEALDAGLLREPMYGQVPAFAGRDRGVLDLLGVRRDGRVCVVEVKASEDVQLPMQALDYWIRVAHHLEQGDFEKNGYFRGVGLKREAPRLLLVAPALEFHPTTEVLLGFVGRHVEVERIGLGVEWQWTLRVVLRVEGARRPEWNGRDDSAWQLDS